MMTDDEKHIGRMALYRDIAMSTLSVDPIRSLVWRTLLFEGEGWTARGLEGFTRRKWSTILRKTNDLEDAKIIERRHDGLFFTADGRRACERLHRQSLQIATHQREGYAPDLIDQSSRISPVHPDAWTISFPRAFPFQVDLGGSD